MDFALTRPEARRQATLIPPFRIPSLDGLRGLAVAGVLLFHTGLLRGGFLGVDLFFVLSGFLITGMLLREASERGGIALAPFWGRRLRRLFPALALVLVVTTLTVWTLQRLGGDAVDRATVSDALSDGLWVQLNAINWHLLFQNASYWDAHGQARVFEHLWSIAVEEQFYLVWPFAIAAIVLLTRRLGRGSADGATLAVSLIAPTLSLAAMVLLLDPADPTRVYTGTDTRAFSLLLGAAAATAPARRLLERLVARSHRGAAWLSGILAVGILASWGLADGTATPGLFTGGLFAHAVACALLVGLCAAAAGRASRLPEAVPSLPMRVLQAKPLTLLGGMSYGLYLWHWPVLVLLPAQLVPGLPRAVWAAAVIAVSLLLAALSKRLVEDPIRFRSRWARGRQGLLVFLGVSAVLLAMWLLLPAPAAPAIDLGGL